MRGGRAEFFQDLVVLEAEAVDGVIEAAAFDGGPIDDRGSARDGVAEN
jgi:hypothetical protein